MKCWKCEPSIEGWIVVVNGKPNTKQIPHTLEHAREIGEALAGMGFLETDSGLVAITRVTLIPVSVPEVPEWRRKCETPTVEFPRLHTGRSLKRTKPRLTV